MNNISTAINEREIEKLEKRIKIIRLGKVTDKKSKNNAIKNDYDENKVSKLISNQHPAEINQKPIAITSKTNNRLKKENERKAILKESSHSELSLQKQSKPIENTKVIDNVKHDLNDRNNNKEKKDSNNKKQTEEELKHNVKQEKIVDKPKIEKKESKPYKDAVIPKMIEEKKNRKKEEDYKAVIEKDDELIEDAEELEEIDDKINNSPKQKKSINKFYKIYEDHEKGGYNYKHLTSKLSLNVPVTGTHEIINSKLPEQKGKYNDIKLILEDERSTKQEIKRCKKKIEELKSKDFSSLQEELQMHLNLDDFTKVIIKKIRLGII